jgi:hypothetical protein
MRRFSISINRLAGDHERRPFVRGCHGLVTQAGNRRRLP